MKKVCFSCMVFSLMISRCKRILGRQLQKVAFAMFFVALAQVLHHPPQPGGVLNELLVYGFLTRRAQGVYRTNEITMVLFSSNTSWTKSTLQNRKGNYNAFSYRNFM